VRSKVDVAGEEDDVVVGVRDALPKELGSRVACKKAGIHLEASGGTLKPAGSPLHNQQYARPAVCTKQGCRRTIQAVARRSAVLHCYICSGRVLFCFASVPHVAEAAMHKQAGLRNWLQLTKFSSAPTLRAKVSLPRLKTVRTLSNLC